MNKSQLKIKLNHLNIRVQGNYIRKEDADRFMLRYVVANLDPGEIPVKIFNSKKAKPVLAKIGISIRNLRGLNKPVLQKLIKRIDAKIEGNRIYWYQNKEVIAAFDIWQKVKDVTKKLLKKGTALFIGLAILAGSASGKDLKKAQDFCGSYEKTLETVGNDMNLDIDADVTIKKVGDGTTKISIELENLEDKDKIIIEVTKDKDGDAVLDFNTVEGDDEELDMGFEILGQEVYDNWKERLQESHEKFKEKG